MTASRTSVDEIAALVVAVPGVHGLHSGLLGEAVTYLPGRRIRGLRVTDSGTRIHIVVQEGAPVQETAEAVRVAVRPHVTGPVEITVESIAPPGAR